MTDTEIVTQPEPGIATPKRPRRIPAEAPAAEAPPPPPSVDAVASVASASEAADAPPPASESPPTPTRRCTRELSGPVFTPFESALPGVSSSEISAELARRERRAAALLAERERVIAALDEIEAAIDVFAS